MRRFLLFVAPAGQGKGTRLLDWPTAKRVPWDILILFGGGLSLADAIQTTGLAGWIGAGMGDLADWPMIVVVGLLVTTVIFMTEVASNTATSATFIPIAAALALVFAVSPFDLAAPVAVAASCAFTAAGGNTAQRHRLQQRGHIDDANGQGRRPAQRDRDYLDLRLHPWAIKLVFG